MADVCPGVGLWASRQALEHLPRLRKTIQPLVAETGEILRFRVRRRRLHDLLIVPCLEPLLDLMRRWRQRGLRKKHDGESCRTHDRLLFRTVCSTPPKKIVGLVASGAQPPDDYLPTRATPRPGWSDRAESHWRAAAASSCWTISSKTLSGIAPKMGRPLMNRVGVDDAP